MLPLQCVFRTAVRTLCCLAGIDHRFYGTCCCKLRFYPEEGGGPHSRFDHSNGEKGNSYCSRPHSAVPLSKYLWQFSVWEIRGSDSGDNEQSCLLWRYAVSTCEQLRELRGIVTSSSLCPEDGCIPILWNVCNYKSTRLNIPEHWILQLLAHLLEKRFGTLFRWIVFQIVQ